MRSRSNIDLWLKRPIKVPGRNLNAVGKMSGMKEVPPLRPFRDGKQEMVEKNYEKRGR